MAKQKQMERSIILIASFLQKMGASRWLYLRQLNFGPYLINSNLWWGGRYRVRVNADASSPTVVIRHAACLKRD
jgi:hypothetical protein